MTCSGTLVLIFLSLYLFSVTIECLFFQNKPPVKVSPGFRAAASSSKDGVSNVFRNFQLSWKQILQSVKALCRGSRGKWK